MALINGVDDVVVDVVVALADVVDDDAGCDGTVACGSELAEASLSITTMLGICGDCCGGAWDVETSGNCVVSGGGG